MPPVESANTMVITTETGHSRITNSWVLGRLLRDTSDKVDDEMSGEAAHRNTGTWSTWTPSFWRRALGVQPKIGPSQRPWEALRIAFYDVIDEEDNDHGMPTRDPIWLSGFGVIIVQLVIAIIPWVVNDEWGTFLITCYGNFLALLGSSLPQWRREKWPCPRNGGPTITLTEGNGSRFAMVIRGQKRVGLNFEILARGSRTAPASLTTRLVTSILAINWIALLISATGLQIDTWCKCCTCLNGLTAKWRAQIFLGLVHWAASIILLAQLSRAVPVALVYISDQAGRYSRVLGSQVF